MHTSLFAKAWFLGFLTLLLLRCDPEQYYVNADPGVILRSGPNSNTRSLQIIPSGEIVRNLNQASSPARYRNFEGRWRFVEYHGVNGWIFDHYLSEQQPAPFVSCIESMQFEVNGQQKEVEVCTRYDGVAVCQEQSSPQGTHCEQRGYRYYGGGGFWYLRPEDCSFSHVCEESLNEPY